MKKKIGFIGLGNMGLPIALNLCKNNFEVLICSSNSESQKKILEAGGGSVGSFQAMAKVCDVIITIVPADQEILSLYREEGILSNANSELICIDMTTAKGTTKQTIARYIEHIGKNIQFIDAPVSGGVSGAENGTLTIMVGCTDAQFEENKDIFQAVGKKIIHTGPVGSASNVKMLNQMLNAANTAAAAEVLCMARKLGVDDKILLEVINQSSGASFVFEKNVPKYMMTDDYNQPGFKLGLMKKDIGLYVDTVKEVKGFGPVSAVIYQLYQAAVNQNASELNYTYIYKWLTENQSK